MMMTEQPLCSAFQPMYPNPNIYYCQCAIPRLHRRSFSSNRKVWSNLYTIPQKMRLRFLHKDRSPRSTTNITLPKRGLQFLIFVEAAKQSIASKRIRAECYGVEYVAKAIQQMLAPLFLTMKHLVLHASVLVTPFTNAICLNTHTNKRKGVCRWFTSRLDRLRDRIYRLAPRSINDRAEEAEDKIYRLPPPGNGNSTTNEAGKKTRDIQEIRQKNITEYFQRINIDPIDRNVNHNTTLENIESQTGSYKLQILQWNACSMSEEKRVQLEFIACKMNTDVLCISELGKHRKIKGYPNYIQCDKFTQSAIFWKNGLNLNTIQTEFDKKHNRTQTQCVLITDTLLLIHSYIAPDLNFIQRKKYWQAIHASIEQWTIVKPALKVIVTGDFNTRDKRFGANHKENHGYLDEILLTLDVVSDSRIPTRGLNTLDVTLANDNAQESNLKCKVIPKLNSDHNPTKTDIDLDCPTSIYDARNYINDLNRIQGDRLPENKEKHRTGSSSNLPRQCQFTRH